MAADELDAAALIAAYEAACVPNESRRDRVLARLLRPGARAVFVEERPRADTAALARAVALAVAAAVLAVLGLELATGARSMGRLEQDRYEAIDAAPQKAEATAIERDDEARSIAHVLPPAELPRTQPSVPPIEHATTPIPVQRPRSDATRTRTRTTAAVAAPVDPERALLDEARAAIDRQAWREAVAALRRHAKEFPTSTLADEREALHIVVDCQLDPAEVTRARRRGAAFVVRHPASDLSRTVIAACRQETPDAPSGVDPFADSP